MACERERTFLQDKNRFPAVYHTVFAGHRKVDRRWVDTVFCLKISDDGIFITSLWERLKEAGENEENEESKIGTVQKTYVICKTKARLYFRLAEIPGVARDSR
jgi:hypothetical protein